MNKNLLTPKTDDEILDKLKKSDKSMNQILISSSVRGFIPGVKYALNKWIKNHDIDIDIDFALRFACKNGYYDITKLLLENGADVHVNNDTCLKITTIMNYNKITKLLLDHGADALVNDSELLKLIHIKKDNIDIIKILIDKGCNVQINNNNILRRSIKCREVEIVKLLLDNGANINYCGIEVSYAIKNNFTDIINIIKEHQKNKGEKCIIDKCLKLTF